MRHLRTVALGTFVALALLVASSAEPEPVEAQAVPATFLVPNVGVVPAAGPWGAVALAALAAGSIYCTLSEWDCWRAAQEFWAQAALLTSVAWLQDGIRDAIFAGEREVVISTFAGYDADEFMAVLEATAALGYHLRVSSHPSLLADVDVAISQSQTMARNVVYSQSEISYTGTFVDAGGTVRDTTRIELLMPTLEVPGVDAAGLRYRHTQVIDVGNGIGGCGSGAVITTLAGTTHVVPAASFATTGAIGGTYTLAPSALHGNPGTMCVQVFANGSGTATTRNVLPGFWWRERSLSTFSTVWTYQSPARWEVVEGPAASLMIPVPEPVWSDPRIAIGTLVTSPAGLGGVNGDTLVVNAAGEVVTLHDPATGSQVGGTDTSLLAGLLAGIGTVGQQVGAVLLGPLQNILAAVQVLYNPIAAIQVATQAIGTQVETALQTAFMPTVSVETRWTSVTTAVGTLPPFSVAIEVTTWIVDVMGPLQDLEPAPYCLVIPIPVHETAEMVFCMPPNTAELGSFYAVTLWASRFAIALWVVSAVLATARRATEAE